MTSKMCSFLTWLTLSACIAFCVASPTRRQFVSITETTSSDPAAVVTNDGEVSWDDSDDDFDLEGDGWLKEVSASPSSIPQSSDYEDYDDDDSDDIVSQDAEESNDSSNQDSEFLFLSPTDTRLVLEDDDDDQSGLIKVRHSSKNSYSDPQEGGDNSVETVEKSDSDGQFVFTIDDDGEDDIDDNENKVDIDNSDFVLDDSEPKTDNSVEAAPRRNVRDDDDDDDDDLVDDDDDEDAMFESPEEDAQVIYGDHVFLY